MRTEVGIYHTNLFHSSLGDRSHVKDTSGEGHPARRNSRKAESTNALNRDADDDDERPRRGRFRDMKLNRIKKVVRLPRNARKHSADAGAGDDSGRRDTVSTHNNEERRTKRWGASSTQTSETNNHDVRREDHDLSPASPGYNLPQQPPLAFRRSGSSACFPSLPPSQIISSSRLDSLRSSSTGSDGDENSDVSELSCSHQGRAPIEVEENRRRDTRVDAKEGTSLEGGRPTSVRIEVGPDRDRSRLVPRGPKLPPPSMRGASGKWELFIGDSP